MVQSIPVLERKVTAQPTSTPSFQSAVEEFAKSDTALSSIGATVAQSASNQMAAQLGYAQGKTPEGDLLPPITEFDKHFEDSYHAQAGATLSIQGQKLLDDAHVEMSKPARLTPELIENTHQQLQLGLNKIAENAPTAIKTQLQSNFDSQLLHQTTQYKTKMIGEQREDQKNNLINALDLNTHTALNLAISGDAKGATNLIKTSEKMAQSAANSRFMTPQEARLAKESVQQAVINGNAIFLAKQAKDAGKLPEFERNFAERKIPGTEKLTNEQWVSAGQAVTQQMGFLQGLESQDQKLEIAKLNTQLNLDPTTVTAQQIKMLQSKLTPDEFERVHLDYIKAMKVYTKTNAESQALIGSFNDPRAFASADPKAINSAFRTLTNGLVKKGHTQDEAEVMVAAKAGGEIPEFTKSVTNRLRSPNPAQIESAAQQIHLIKELGGGQVLNSLSKQDLGMYNSFEAIRDSQDPVKAAQQIHDMIYSQDPDVATANDQKWTNKISTTKPTGTSYSDFGLINAGLSKATFMNEGDKTLYGNDLLEEYKSYFTMTGGDDKTAKKMLQDSVASFYGYTYINGSKQMTKHPIEKVLNLPEDAIGVVQEDISNQLQTHFTQNKVAYDKGEVNEYWELTPRTSSKSILDAQQIANTERTKEGFTKNALSLNNPASRQTSEYSKGNTLEVVRHTRGGESKKYNVIIKANPFASTTDDQNHPIQGGWDIAISSDSGTRNLFREAPYLGVITYSPDIGFIRSTYTKFHPLT